MNEPVLHKCEVCGAEAVLTPADAFNRGWVCEPFIYAAVVCPNCPLDLLFERLMSKR